MWIMFIGGKYYVRCTLTPLITNNWNVAYKWKTCTFHPSGRSSSLSKTVTDNPGIHTLKTVEDAYIT